MGVLLVRVQVDHYRNIAYVQGIYGDPEITPASQTLIDQDPSTSYDWEVSSAEEAYTATKYVQRHRLTLALGEQFFLDRVRLVAREGHYPDRLTLIATLDEPLGVDLNLGPVGQILARVPDNHQDTLELRFPPAPARTLELDLARITPKQVQLAEIEVYGQGYIRHAEYVSPFIDLGEPAIWGPLRWQGYQTTPGRGGGGGDLPRPGGGGRDGAIHLCPAAHHAGTALGL